MPPRARRGVQFAVEADPDANSGDANRHPTDTSGDAALAQRLHEEALEERAGLLRQRQEQNRRNAIQQAALDDEDAPMGHGMADYQNRLGIGRGGAAQYGFEPYEGAPMLPQYPAYAGRVVQAAPPGRARWLNENFLQQLAMARGRPLGPGEGVNFEDLRARLEQSVQDSWGGINFVPRQNPLLGFTFDFDKDAEDAPEPTEIVRLDFDDDAPIIEELDNSGKSTGKGQLGRKGSAISIDKDGNGMTSLVCASCYAPLRVSQGQRNDGDKVFALRCGHLLDKRCLDDISQPKPDQTLDQNEQDHKPGFVKLGSGSKSRQDGNFVVHGDYGRAEATPVASTSTLPRIVSPPSPPKSPTRTLLFGPARVVRTSEFHRMVRDGEFDIPDPQPARGTRRSARVAAGNTSTSPAAHYVEDSSESESGDMLHGSQSRSGRGRGRGGNPRKRKARDGNFRATAAAIKKLAKPEEKREYRWLCPVVACGREHFSEEIGGAWKPTEGMTVQLFV